MNLVEMKMRKTTSFRLPKQSESEAVSIRNRFGRSSRCGEKFHPHSMGMRKTTQMSIRMIFEVRKTTQMSTRIKFGARKTTKINAIHAV